MKNMLHLIWEKEAFVTLISFLLLLIISGLELQRLLKGTGITSAFLIEDGDEMERFSDGLQLPLPGHSPDIVCGGPDYSGKVQFLREVELKATTRREREGMNLAIINSNFFVSNSLSYCVSFSFSL